jgi:hypothetical protein
MNFTHVPDRNAAGISVLVEDAIRRISTPAISEGLRTFLIPPRQHMRSWDWHKPYVEYPVWVAGASALVSKSSECFQHQLLLIPAGNHFILVRVEG